MKTLTFLFSFISTGPFLVLCVFLYTFLLLVLLVPLDAVENFLQVS